MSNMILTERTQYMEELAYCLSYGSMYDSIHLSSYHPANLNSSVSIDHPTTGILPMRHSLASLALQVSCDSIHVSTLWVLVTPTCVNGISARRNPFICPAMHAQHILSYPLI